MLCRGRVSAQWITLFDYCQTISTSTVQWRLRESGLHGPIAAKKPLLRMNKKKKRIVWAKKHKEWTLNQWKSVLWSDESKFEIVGSYRCVFAEVAGP